MIDRRQPAGGATLVALQGHAAGGFHIVAEDAADPDGLRVVGGWDSKAVHDALLAVPAAPMIDGSDGGPGLNVPSLQTGPA